MAKRMALLAKKEDMRTSGFRAHWAGPMRISRCVWKALPSRDKGRTETRPHRHRAKAFLAVGPIGLRVAIERAVQKKLPRMGQSVAEAWQREIARQILVYSTSLAKSARRERSPRASVIWPLWAQPLKRSTA